MKCLGKYKNGNYQVHIFEDGTKIRENDLDFFESSFPENIDIKISNRCDMGCAMCHERSTIDGKNANLLALTFIDTLRPYTELAIGGGNVFENPQLISFLFRLRDRKIIANITINQIHFEQNYELVKKLTQLKLVYGVGVSLTDPSEQFVNKIKSCGQNMVIHVINGIVTKEQIEKLANNNLKILFLGYKDFGRGEEYQKKYKVSIDKNKVYTEKNIEKFLKWFRVVSFDNLAIDQINPKRFLTQQEFNEFYMGDEGQFTMYIDAVKKQFGQNSISVKRYSILDDIEEMFKVIKNESVAKIV